MRVSGGVMLVTVVSAGDARQTGEVARVIQDSISRDGVEALVLEAKEDSQHIVSSQTTATLLGAGRRS